MVATDRCDFPLARWMTPALIAVAAFQCLGSLQMLPVLLSPEWVASRDEIGGLVITAVILLSPVVAITGFVSALKGHLARAVTAVAGVSLLDWIAYVPSFVRDWPDEALWTFPGPFVFFVLPACAPVAMVLAWFRRYPKLAFWLAVAPWALRAALTTYFAIHAAIYGF